MTKLVKAAAFIIVCCLMAQGDVVRGTATGRHSNDASGLLTPPATLKATPVSGTQDLSDVKAALASGTVATPSDPSPVPEPGFYGVVALGAGALLLAFRRRRPEVPPAS